MSSKGSKKSSKKEKGEKRPRAPTGFILFSNERRAEVRERLGGKEIKVTDISKELGKMWKAMSDKEKAKYNDQSKAQQEKLNRGEGVVAKEKTKAPAKKKKRTEKTEEDNSEKDDDEEDDDEEDDD